jgi:hypothetical protein
MVFVKYAGEVVTSTCFTISGCKHSLFQRKAQHSTTPFTFPDFSPNSECGHYFGQLHMLAITSFAHLSKPD